MVFGDIEIDPKTRVACEEHHYRQQEQNLSAMNNFKGSDVVLHHQYINDHQ